MATIKRVENQIAHVEGFDVIFITEDGRDVRGDRAGIPGYASRFENAAPGRMTVEGWKERRFRPVYPGFEVEVIMADGAHARGNVRLETVRSSYEARE
ncbi:MAG: hypothetical protein JOZ38_01515 [Candidatus Eremiobacteraeota bacterium]|nr:hypothetical protein [Candidatus Eremiobacteraeota bacterium]